MKKDRIKEIFLNTMLIFLIIISSISVVQGIRNSIIYSTDFQYDSAKVFSMRVNPYDETLHPDAVLVNPQLKGLASRYDRLEANQFPSLLTILLPFVVFPPQVANVVWAFVNLILTVVMLLFIKKLFLKGINTKLFIVLCCLMLSGLSWRTNIGMGQHTIFSVTFFLIALWLSQNNRSVLSSIALAISYFKYTLTVPLAIYLVYKKKYKELFISVVIHIVITILSAWWISDSILNMIIKPLKVSSWLGNQGFIDIGSIFGFLGSYTMVISVLLILGCFLFGIILRKNDAVSSDFFAMLCYVSLVVVYHRVYDFFILVIPLGIYLVDCVEKRKISFEMIIATCIFLYSNYVFRVIKLVTKMVPTLECIDIYSRYLLAAIVYTFILFLGYKCIILCNKKNT